MNGKLPIRIGNLINTSVYGGPYRWAMTTGEQVTFGVKLAVEIDQLHAVSVPIRDFSVPDEKELRAGLTKVLTYLIGSKQMCDAGMEEPPMVYVGCMGGWGRTGLFLSCLAKVASEYRKLKKRGGFDPIEYVRKNYSPRAVETREQEDFVYNLDVSDIVGWLDDTQVLMRGDGLFEDVTPSVSIEDMGAMREPKSIDWGQARGLDAWNEDKTVSGGDVWDAMGQPEVSEQEEIQMNLESRRYDVVEDTMVVEPTQPETYRAAIIPTKRPGWFKCQLQKLVGIQYHEERVR